MQAWDLAGRRAVVTGASRGIGREIALGLARSGASVMCVARNQDALDDVVLAARAEGSKALAFAADLHSETAVRNAIQHAADVLGGIDILVNNAGERFESPLIDTTLADWRRVLEMNVETTFLCCREASRHLFASDNAKVVNVGSVVAIAGALNNAAYIASKGAVVAFTRALALEWAPMNVQVNALCPGFIQTDMTVGLWGDQRGSDWVVKRTPMRRWGTPADVIGSAVFLSSSASDFITGQAIYVDGGWSAQ